MNTNKYPKLRAYLRSLEVNKQIAFAAECGTTLGYLRKFLSKGGKMDVVTVALLVDKSKGAIPAAELRPDVQWGVFEVVVQPPLIQPRKSRAKARPSRKSRANPVASVAA